MRIECDNCKAVYNIDDALLSDQPIGAQCPYCAEVKVVSRTNAPALDLMSPGSKPAEEGGLFGAARPSAPGLELDDAGRFGGAPSPAGGGVELDTEAKCNVCGTPLRDEFDKVIGLCETHQRERAGSDAASGGGAGARYRVKRSSGEVIGPFSFEELKAKARNREITPEDRYSTENDPGFKELRRVPELSNLFALADAAAAKPKVKPRRAPINLGFLIYLLVLVALLGAAGAVFYFVAPEQAEALIARVKAGAGGGLVGRGNPLAQRIPDFKKKHGAVTETAAELRAKAGKAFALDTERGHEEARELLEKALVAAPNDPELAAEYAENEILGRGIALSGEELDLVSSVADWVVKTAPDRSAGHRAKAAYQLLVGELDEARNAAEQALKRDASDMRAKLLLAEAFVEGNHDFAILEAEAAVSAAPELRRADRILGRAYQLAGRYTSAFKVLQTRLSRDTNNASVLTLIGDTERALGQLSNAEARYRAALGGRGAVNEARLALGLLLLERESPDAAAAVYRKLAEDPSQPVAHRREAYAGWARAHFLNRQWKQADRLANAAIKLGNREAAAFLVRAEVALETGSSSTAQEMANRTLEIRRGEPAALVVLGRVAVRAGNLAEAVKLLEEAAQNDARDPRLWAVLAASYLRFNSEVPAFITLRKVLEIDPAERDARNRQSLLGLSPFAVREAQGAFEGHMKQDRDRSLSHAAVGVLEYHSGRAAAAREAFQRAIRGDSGNMVALLYDAHLALERNEPGRAKKALDLLLKIEKSSLIGNLIAARSAIEARDLNDAQEHLDVALRTARGYAPAVVEQGYLALARNDREMAVKIAQPVFRVNPYSLRARRLMRMLEL